MNDLIKYRKSITIGFIFVIWFILIFIIIGTYISGFFSLAFSKVNPFNVSLYTYLSFTQNIAFNKNPKLIYIAGFIGYVLPSLIILILYFLHLSKQNSLHGDAAFSNRLDIKRAGLFSNSGAIIGQFEKIFLFFNDLPSMLLMAPTRSGKGVSTVVPMSLTYPDSLVVLDLKGEVFRFSSGYRQSQGQDVFVFSPFSVQKINPETGEIATPDECQKDPLDQWEILGFSHGWNMLEYISKHPLLRVGQIQELGRMLFKDLGTDNDFFKSGARTLYLGLVLYLMDTQGTLTMGTVLRLSQSNGTPISPQAFFKDIVEQGIDDGVLSKACISCILDVANMPDKTFGSVISEFKTAFEPWNNPIVDAATSTNDFDFRQLRRRRMSIYIIVTPQQLQVAPAVMNIFFTQLLNANTDFDAATDLSIKNKLLVIADEFTSLGEIKPLITNIAFMAGYWIQWLFVLQNYEQLESVYKKEGASTIIKNVAINIIFPPRETEDAERISKYLGTITRKVISTGRSGSSKFFSNEGNKSENYSEVSRALMLPQELIDIGRDHYDFFGRKKPEQIIIYYEKIKPILTTKIRYYEDSRFMRRIIKQIDNPRILLGASVAKLNNPIPSDSTITNLTASAADFVKNFNEGNPDLLLRCLQGAMSNDSEKSELYDFYIAKVIEASQNSTHLSQGASASNNDIVETDYFSMDEDSLLDFDVNS